MQKFLLSIGTKNWVSGSQASARLPLNCEVRGGEQLRGAVLYARNPRKNDAVVDRICSSIRQSASRFRYSLAATARSLIRWSRSLSR